MEDPEAPVVVQVDVQRKIKLHIDKAVVGYPEPVSQLFLLMVPLKKVEFASKRTLLEGELPTGSCLSLSEQLHIVFREVVIGCLFKTKNETDPKDPNSDIRNRYIAEIQNDERRTDLRNSPPLPCQIVKVEGKGSSCPSILILPMAEAG